MPYTKAQTLLGSGSTGTSTPYLIADARMLTVSVETSTTSTSAFTIWFSNGPGLRSPLQMGSFSVATVLTQRGVYAIEPGARWIMAERPANTLSAASNATLTLQRYHE